MWRRLLIRVLLAAYPRRFRERHGRPLVQTLLADARTASGRLAAWRLLAGAVNIVRTGLAERAGWSGRDPDTPGGGRTGRPVGWRADLGHVRRSLARRPGFTTAVFVTLAIGIGVNAAVFSVVNSVLLRPLPYRDPARLGFVWTKLAWLGVPRAWMSGPHIELLKREVAGIEDVAALRTQSDDLTGRGAPQLIRSGVASTNLFDVLGVRPMLGRGFAPEDAPRDVAVLSYDFWQQLGGDPAIVGSSIDLSGARTEVIGVLPASCRFLVNSSLGDPVKVDLWLPTDWKLSTLPDGSFGFAALVRVKPGETIAGVQEQLDVLGARLDRETYHSRGFGWRIIGVRDDLVKNARPALLLLLVAAACLLVIVCANVGGLMLVRGAERRREFAVRAALGASRWRIVRLVLLEGIVLAVTAGCAGALLASATMRVVVAGQALPIPRLSEVSVDWRVLAFTLALSVAAAVAFALVPALVATRDDAAPVLAQGARGSSGRTHWLRPVLVVAELALAVMFVASAVLLFRSYTAARAVDPGFDPRGVLTADVLLHEQRYRDPAQITSFGRALVDRLAPTPGIVALGLTSSAPLAGNTDQSEVRVLDGPHAADGIGALSDVMWASPGYFRAMGIPVLAGRAFTWNDRQGTTPVAIVDETFARAAGIAGDAVGRRITVDDGVPLTIVGVVRQARQYQIERDGRQQVYRAFAQAPSADLTIAVRTTGDPNRLAGPIRSAVGALNPLQPVAHVKTMASVTSDALAARRLQLQALGAFGAGALLLAALGIYGILSSLVAERTREIGIRVALGASARQVQRLVVRQALVCVAAGAGIGTAGALAVSRLVSQFLYGISPRDPWSLALTLGVLGAAAALAAYVPARRASRVDPVVALRAD
jgi:putative ABC transport system permease protein